MAKDLKPIPNLDFLTRELADARVRLQSQFEMVKRCQEGLAAAISLGLTSTEASLRVRLKRQQAAHGATQSVVSELEAQIGQLQLGPR